MNQQPKALISARAKKFISSQLFVTNFYFKGTQQFTGRFPIMIGFVTLGHLLFRGSCKKGGLNEDKRQHFIVGDIDSIVIEGTINVLNFRT